MHSQFVKMQGLGNDFVLLDGRHQALALEPAALARLADRRYGVGCDQILVVETPDLPEALVRYRVFNADGSAAEHCGNGVRCVARYLQLRGEAPVGELRVQIGSRSYELRVQADGNVRVEMGVPEFEPARIPLAVPCVLSRYTLADPGGCLEFGAVSMGNPHAVFQVASVDAAPVLALGSRLQREPLFPARVNVGFMQIEDQGRIRLRVYERGVGETPACGTGACAAVAVGRCWGVLGPAVAVVLPGGTLQIEWPGPGQRLFMTGPAELVFEGNITL